PDAGDIPDSRSGTAEQELLIAERHAALREAFTTLPSRWQQLLALLIEDPPVPYTQISATLGIPIGSIGPIRRRCLDKLRCHPAITALINDDDDGPEAERRGPSAGVAPASRERPRQRRAHAPPGAPRAAGAAARACPRRPGGPSGPSGRPHPAIRGLPDKPRRPERLDHPR